MTALLHFCAITDAQSTAETNTVSLADSINDLGFELLRRAVQSKPNQNILISPVSLAFGLSLVEQGADPEAEREISKILRTTHLTKEQLKTAILELRAQILHPKLPSPSPDPRLNEILQASQKRQREGQVIDIADSVWVNNRFPVQSDFLHIAQSDFAADIKPADFSSPQTCDQIKAWVSEKTHGKITSAYCPDPSSPTPMLLINALYFHQDWARPFSKTNTRPDTFNNPAGATKRPFMNSQLAGAHAKPAGLRHAALSYKDPSFQMDLLLPDAKNGLTNLINEIGGGWFRKELNQMEYGQLEVKLPRFQIRDELDLKNNLQQMGLHHATHEPSFPGLAPQIYIDKIIQKTFIDVDEAGTEAAAVTFMGPVTTGIGPHPPEKIFKIVLDHPFLFTLRHKSGVLLFIGAISNPGA